MEDNNIQDSCCNSKYASIRQMDKLDEMLGRRFPFYPRTVIQAVHDGRTGASLEAILAQYNNIYVQYQGTAGRTRNIVPKEMRRKGIIISYVDMQGNAITEKCVNDAQKDNFHWGLDVNWVRVDELTLSGDISVSVKGTWVINDEDTGIAALGPKGDNGLTPWLKTIDNKLHFSYDNETWEECSDYIAAYFRFQDNKFQISRDNKTWSDLSGEVTNSLSIKAYVTDKSQYPNPKQGDMIMVGPTYADDDAEHTKPIYHLNIYNASGWMDHGPFQSINAGVVQELGDSKTEVMSQRTVSNNLIKLAGYVFDLLDFENGQWIGTGQSIYPNSTEGYLRLKQALEVDIPTGGVIRVIDTDYNRVRFSDLGLVIKFTDVEGNHVESGYADSGYQIQVQGTAKYMYIHASTEKISAVSKYSIWGLYYKPIFDYIRFAYIKIGKTQKNVEDTRDIANNALNELKSLSEGVELPYLPCNTLEILLKHAYVGNTLGDNPISNATNNAYSRIDVSSIENGTLLYLKNAEDANIFMGTWKFFGSDGNQITATVSGTSGKDRGYLKPNGATVLGLHIGIASITENDQEQWMKSLKIYGIPYVQTGLKGQISELDQKVEKNRDETEANIKNLNERLESMEHKYQSYKEALKVLFIGSSFGVDTVREVGSICASFGKNVILGNAYIGAATLDVFLKRFQGNKGVTYYKWKYQATAWEQYNGTTGKWSSDPDSDITDEGEPAPANDTVLMDWLLADEAWDFIIMQNGAYQSPYEDQSSFWEKGEDGQITRNIVQELIDLCKKACLYSNPVFCMNMTWAFSVYHTISESHGPNGADDDYWLSYGNNQKERQLGMWRNIAKNYKDCISNCPDVKFIIPSGTAVQNARTVIQLRQSTNYASASPAIPTIQKAETITDLTTVSDTYPFMNNVANWTNKNDFTRDTIHADFGITRYLVAATLFQSFIAKIYNLDIANCSYRISQGGGDYREQLCTPVDEENFALIIRAVKAAVGKPFEITTIVE